MGLFNARYSKEEKAEFEDRMLEMIPEGLYIKEMAEHLGIGENDAHRIKDKLISEGRTSKVKIKEAIKKRKDREKRERLLTDSDIKKIIDGLYAGKSYKKISEGVRYSASRIGQLVEILAEAGMIDIEKIKNEEQSIEPKANEQDSNNQNQQTSDRNLKKYETLKLMEMGIPTKQIRKIVGVTLEEFKEIKAELEREVKISPSQIQNAIEAREQKNRKIIKDYLIEGYNYEEISEKIPYSDRRYVERIANVLKNEGEVTEEEIQEGKNRREAKIRKFIIDNLENGLIVAEIADIEWAKENGLTEPAIRNRIYKLRDEGIITPEDEVVLE